MDIHDFILVVVKMSNKLIPNNGNDKIYTPLYLSKFIIDYFNPKGLILDPCLGDGSFYNQYPVTESKDWCEIDKGKDFFSYSEKVDWVVSNFPWSKMRHFLLHSMEISDNIVSLSLVNAIFMKARLRDIKKMNFGIKEILLLETPPKPWPQAGLQLGAIHLQKGYKKNKIKFSGFYV